MSAKESFMHGNAYGFIPTEHGRPQGGEKRAFPPPWKLRLRTKIFKKAEISSSIPIN